MAANLIEMAKGMLTPELVSKTAEATGESPDSTFKAMRGAVPATLAGFGQSASTPGGAASVYSAITGGGLSGSGLMSKVLGDHAGAVGDTLARGSGIKSSSASHILTLVFPMVAGLLGKQVLSNRLNPAGLSQMLFSHKKAILDDPDAPAGLAGSLGIPALTETHGAASVDVTQARAAAPRARSRSGALLPVLLILGALLAWGIAALTRHAPKGGVTAPQPTMPEPKVSKPTMPTMPTAPKVEAPKVEVPKVEAPAGGPIQLPGGKMLDVDRNGPEAQMADYLGDKSASLPHTFEFSTLSFESGTTTLVPGGPQSIDALATMMNAYPSARVRLEGNTDTVGDPAANQALSKARANTVADMLAQRGIARDRIETEGKSQHNPAAGNESQEGRARNRRVDVVLLSR
jgi:outer membrane protein OmpA-like peptidoglycan-associated protein